MEKLAHDRDQTAWACSAQQPKMLPKTSSQKQRQAMASEVKRRVAPLFDRYENG